MQFDKMNCTILKLYGRLSFQLTPTSSAECLMQPTNLPNRPADRDGLDLFNTTDDFKILIHQRKCGLASHCLVSYAQFGTGHSGRLLRSRKSDTSCLFQKD